MPGLSFFSRALIPGLCVVGLLAAAVAASGRGQQPGATPRPSAGCTTDGLHAGDTVMRVTVAGQVRTARVHLPRAALGHPAPLLLAFHGAGGTGRFMEGYSGLTAPLNAAGAVGVFPDAEDGRWRLDEDDAATDGDLAFARALLDALEATICVDARRVWATGVSNGGGFTARLACVMADRLAAVAVVAGGYSSLPDCRPSRPVSVLEVHGTADPIVPYRGSPRSGRRGAVRPWLDGWAQRNGCRAAPGLRRVAPRVDRFTWTGCRKGTTVAHVRIAGGVHQWPGASPPDAGPQVRFATAGQIWRFVSGLSLP